MQPVRLAPTSSQADEWALVLTAVGIPNAVEPDVGGWVVLAAPDDLARAQAALAAYDEERRAYDDERRVDATPAPAPSEPYPWMSGIALGLLLLWLFSVTGGAAAGSPWFAHGRLVAGKTLGGELWRVVTALTLHVDVVHVAGNAVALAVLLPPLVQRFGAGVALMLLLLSGALGHLASALAHDPRHSAVGASTAAFGAVGILVALRLLPHDGASSRKRWTAPVAGVVLLVTLGAARDADLAAHAFGFLAGVLVGLVGGLGVRQRPGPMLQWVVGALVAVIVALCWRVALRS